MKIKVITTAIIILFAAKSFAQDAATANMQSAINTAYTETWDKQTQNLNLTTTQVSQWQALDATDLKQAQVIVSSIALTNNEKQTQLTALNEQQQAQLKTILKPAQYTKWNAEKVAVKQSATGAASSVQSKAATRPVRAGGGKRG